MVFHALDGWNSDFSPWDHKHIHRIRSLSSKDGKKLKGLDHTVYNPDLLYCLLLSLPRKMGIHTKAKRDPAGRQ